MSHRFLFPAILILGLAACDNKAFQPRAAADSATNSAADSAPAQVQNSQAEKPSNAVNLPPPPSGADAANLARAMGGGAAGIMPDDAPKDKYGKPYIIGDLGGVPVNLPSAVVHLVEYSDSPGWDREKLRNYKPPKRTYQSVINSFGFEFRHSDGELLDIWANKAIARKEQQQADNPWIDVGISTGEGFQARFKGGRDTYLNAAVDKLDDEGRHPTSYYEKTGEIFHGLELYASPGIDPDTGIPWRQHRSAEDIFVAWNKEGNVSTIIKCTNRNVPRPPCRHRFLAQINKNLAIRLNYSRHVLKDWQKFERMAESIIAGFSADPNQSQHINQAQEKENHNGSRAID